MLAHINPLPWFTLPATEKATPTHAVIIGAGLAGCSTARALAERGWQVTLLEQGMNAASGASGNHCALLRPHASRESSVAQQFFADAFNEALGLMARLAREQTKENFYHQTGALQLTGNRSGYQESAYIKPVSRKMASELCGINVPSGGLFFPSACTVDIAATCKALLTHPGITSIYSFEAKHLYRDANSWQISNDTQAINASTVVMANGASLANFPATEELTIIAARGQTTIVDAGQRVSPKIPICGHHYLIPQHSKTARQNNTPHPLQEQRLWQIGASFDRNNTQPQIMPLDDEKNVNGIIDLLGEQRVQEAPLDELKTVGHWAAVRATTPDRLPLVGALPDAVFFRKNYADLHHGRPPAGYPDARYLPGMYVNGGFGSRGLCLAALCAELLAGQITKNAASLRFAADNSKISRYLQLLHPARFHIRRLKKPECG